MSDEEIRIAVAKLCGWEPCNDRLINYEWAPGHISQVAAEWKNGERSAMTLPDYQRDLNACAEFRKTLTLEEREDYVWELMKRIHSRSSTHWDCADATARDHCEAFLRVKGVT
jgi:hypothetical protein